MDKAATAENDEQEERGETSIDTTYVRVQTPKAAGVTPVVIATNQPRSENSASFGKANESQESVESHENKDSVTIVQLFSFADRMDKILLFFGLFASVVSGVLLPLMALVFGNAVNSFVNVDMSEIRQVALQYVGLAVGLLVTGYVGQAFLAISAERQMKALRIAYFRAVLKQELAWFDQNNSNELTTRISDDIVKMQEGIGDKFGLFLQLLAQFITGYIVGFVKGWNMSLVMASVMPLIVITFTLLMTRIKKMIAQSRESYAAAGSVAEETLSSIRTVASLNAEKAAFRTFQEKTDVSEEMNLQTAWSTSIAVGTLFASIWITYGVGLWYGGYLLTKQDSVIDDPGTVLSAFYAILIGTFALGQISPNITSILTAKAAAQRIFRVLGRKPIIVDEDDVGEKMIFAATKVPQVADGLALAASKKGKELVAFDNVHFAYASRLNVPVFSSLTFQVEEGSSVAFVGSSGGGKSTIFSLIQRFYDPLSGTIRLNGKNIREINVRSLRSHMALVSQEPVLFDTTIYENIRLGTAAMGKEEEEEEVGTKEDVMNAAKMANIHHVIMQLPLGYDTVVGELGTALSGGQKQRIALARALLRKPRILLLDEATSALDSKSERIVQASLAYLKSQTSMTILLIAHRLSTIRSADKIFVLCGGHVVEEGTHGELMAKPNGEYKKLVALQANEEDEEHEVHEVHDDEANNDLQRKVVDIVDVAVVADPVVRTEEEVMNEPGEDKLTVKTLDFGDDAVEATRDPEGKKKSSSPFRMSRVWALNRPYRLYFYLGVASTAVNGVSFPISALLLSQVISEMTRLFGQFQSTSDVAFLKELYNVVELYASIYLAGSVVLAFFGALSTYVFKFLKEKLATQIRLLDFSAMLRQDIGFFDDAKNHTGILTTRLAVGASLVTSIAGENQARLLQNVFTLAFAVLVSFLLGSWQLTLLMLCVLPFLLLGLTMRMKASRQGEAERQSAFFDSGKNVREAIADIKTVMSYDLGESMGSKYNAALVKPHREGIRMAHLTGLASGVSSFVMFSTYAAVFWYGGYLVSQGTITFTQLLRTLMAIMMAAQGLAHSTSMITDVTSAKETATQIFRLQDRKPTIDASSTEGLELACVEGRIVFDNVTFAYPTRPSVCVLNKCSLEIKAGQTVALCGPSGQGKSTLIALVERFYDPLDGSVQLDGVDIRHLNVRWLRSQLGLVGQEPVLFTGTIADNVRLGKPGVDFDAIVEACQKAHAHEFIMQFPHGYDTQVGVRGTQLSGGQKQRIAIARAIIKNPAILLLDEATSALDTESEHLVQEALDRLLRSHRRTTLVIAHRLSTIRQADQICVVSKGVIAEKGTHDELVALGKEYAALLRAQGGKPLGRHEGSEEGNGNAICRDPKRVV